MDLYSKLNIIDEDIFKCNLCKNLVEKFSNDASVYLEKNNDIVLIGEAPANNGWRKAIRYGIRIKEKLYLVVLYYKNYLT